MLRSRRESPKMHASDHVDKRPRVKVQRLLNNVKGCLVLKYAHMREVFSLRICQLDHVGKRGRYWKWMESTYG